MKPLRIAQIILPVAALAGLIAMFVYRLQSAPIVVSLGAIDIPAPQIDLPPLFANAPGVSGGKSLGESISNPKSPSQTSSRPAAQMFAGDRSHLEIADKIDNFLATMHRTLVMSEKVATKQYRSAMRPVHIR